MEQFIVQPFVAAKGKVKPAKPIEVKSEQACRFEARRQAEAGGAAAIKVDIDDDTGQAVSINVLERIGSLPDDFDDNVGV